MRAIVANSVSLCIVAGLLGPTCRANLTPTEEQCISFADKGRSWLDYDTWLDSMFTCLRHVTTAYGPRSADFLHAVAAAAFQLLLAHVDDEKRAAEMLDLRILASRAAEQQFFTLHSAHGQNASTLVTFAQVALCAGNPSCAAFVDLVRMDLRLEFYPTLQALLSTSNVAAPTGLVQLVSAIGNAPCGDITTKTIIMEIKKMPVSFSPPDLAAVDSDDIVLNSIEEQDVYCENLFHLLVQYTKHIETMVILGRPFPLLPTMHRILHKIRTRCVFNDTALDGPGRLNLKIATKMAVMNQWHSELVERMFHRRRIAAKTRVEWALTAFRGPVDMASLSQVVSRAAVLPADLVRWDYSDEFLAAMATMVVPDDSPPLYKRMQENIKHIVQFARDHRDVSPLGMTREKVTSEPTFFHYFVLRWAYVLDRLLALFSSLPSPQ